jgi:hypothetical protein
MNLIRFLRIAMISGLPMAASVGLTAGIADGEPRFPDSAAMTSGPLQVRTLPGHSEFIFSMYGAPGDLEKLRQLVSVMKEQKLGNGFDPLAGLNPDSRPIFDYAATVGWPAVYYSGAEMQIQGGRSVFGKEHAIAISAMDRAGIFSAVQIGEWGYYFHNLAPREGWWRDVYGKDFENFKHLMKPAGLAGYVQRPRSKKECYDIVRDYFVSRNRDLLGRTISVTGHSHYEAYVGEWGTRCVGLEVGENIAFTQSKLAFARGASRQWRKPWSVQVSPWFHGACTTSGPLRQEGGGALGLDAGHSLSFYERMWLHGWFAGAAMVTPENSVAIFFEQPEAPWTLTEHGRKASAVFQFTQGHERGVPYTPVAIVLDHYAGYNGYMDKPWGILELTEGDRQLRDLFDFQLYPGADHIHGAPDPKNPEAAYLRPTPHGEIFDVLVASGGDDLLLHYPVILLAGDMTFDDVFLTELEKALRHGSKLLLSPAHRAALGKEYDRLAGQGTVEVLEAWKNPETGRSTAISDDRLRSLREEYLPVQVSGDPIEYAINRTSRGWVVELINNQGVTKRPGQPAEVDPSAVARVSLKARIPTRSFLTWRSSKASGEPGNLKVEIGPGTVEYVELDTP